jgi:glyoxylase-like metal-dependent hydrolase (beta-lactamase superfamily II)
VTDPSPPAVDRPRRQEQEEASSEITEVAPGVLRLQLPVFLPGLGHVNAYALEDADGFALVDPGLPGERSWQALVGRLDAAGIPQRRVHTVIVTHSHPDHYGGAAQLADGSGARIIASEHFRVWWDPTDQDGEELIDADPDGLRERIEIAVERFGQRSPWGGDVERPTDEHISLLAANPAEAIAWLRVPRPTHRVAHDDHVTLAGRPWVGLFTPGHTNDHLCLFDPTEGVLLSGDHVLPSITPHISGMVAADALAAYVRSLDEVAALPGIQTVLPAHGHPFHDLPGRVEAIKAHHEERLAHLRAASQALGWASVEDLSHQLFSERSWGSMAESETFAHLEHLRLSGEAVQRRDGGTLLYAPA